MNTRILLLFSMLLVLALLAIPQAHGRPYRQKRVSDQRLAELETYMALRNLAGKLVTVPVGFGQVDPARMTKRNSDTDLAHMIAKMNSASTTKPGYSRQNNGRRRRRSAELLLQELLNSPAHEEASDADAILSDNIENDDDLRDVVGQHRPQQWLPDWSPRAQV